MRMQVAEDRLDDAESAAIGQAAFAAIDSRFHCGDLGMHVFDLAAIEEGHLPIRADIGLSHTFGLTNRGLSPMLFLPASS